MKIPFIILLFCCSFSTNIFGQTYPLDTSLMQRLQIARSQSNLDTAIIWTNIILLEAKKKTFSPLTYASLKQLSDLYFEQKKPVQALQAALEILSRLDTSEYKLLSITTQHIGDIYFSEGIYSAALNYYLNALSIEENSKRILALFKKTGDAFFLSHQLDSAAIYFQKERNIHHDSKNYKGELNSLQQIAKIHELQGDCHTALQFYRNIERLVMLNDDPNEIAIVYNNIGYQYHCLGEHVAAITNFNKALSYNKAGSPLHAVTILTNLGIAFYNNNKFSVAINYLERGLNVAKKEKNEKEVGLLYNLLAKAYYGKGDLYEALVHNDKAEEVTLKAKEHDVLKDIYLTKSDIYKRLYEYDKALIFQQKHLNLRDSLLSAERFRQAAFMQYQFSLERSEKEIKLLLVNQQVQDLTIQRLQLEANNRASNYALETAEKVNKLALLEGEKKIQEEQLRVKALQALQVSQELSIAKQDLDAAKKDREISSLKAKETQQALEITKKEAAEKAQEQQILLLNNEKKVQQLEIEKQSEFQQFIYWIMAALSVILLLILIGYIFARRTNRKLERQKKEIEAQKIEIEAQKGKSEALLLNILPEETAQELLTNGFAKPRYYDKVSVLFADFENFTKLSEKMSPTDLIEELNICFIAFDEITSRHGLEKIKTIGDAYMCAGGIPVENKSNAQNAVDAALEMMQFINQRYAAKLANKSPYWRMRIGIHTGPVVAGVVGNKKFAYDIWGDTVNTASRMETNSIPGEINISKNTYKELSDAYICDFRGKLPIKNKADAEMYFVKS